MANGWTLERRQRQAVLIQRWKPWEKSTGAKTLEGKAASSRNSLKHGMFSAENLKQLAEIREMLRP
jgi:hypothetical protein